MPTIREDRAVNKDIDTDSVITIGGGGGFLPKDKKPKKSKVKFDKDHFKNDADGELNSVNDIVIKRVEISADGVDVNLATLGEDVTIKIYYA